MGRLLGHYPVRVALSTSFALQGTMAMVMAMTSLALAHHGYALPAVSLAVASHVVGMYGLSLPLGYLTDRLGRRAVMLGGVVLKQLLENLSRKDVAPIRGSPYNLMAYDIVLHNFRSSLYKRGPLCGRFNSNFPIRLCPR